MEIRRRRRRERSEVSLVTKYFLFFENFLMWVIGLAFTAVGTYILVIKKKVVNDAIDFFLDPACDMCLAGTVIIFIAFFGCMGSLRENTIFLKIYYYVLSIILLGEIVLAILAFIFYYAPDVRDKLNLLPEKTFKDAIVKYRDDPDMQNLIDNMQETLQCCGISNDDEGYKDWNANLYFNCSESNPSPEKCSVPPSCCKREAGEPINLQCGEHITKIENGVLVTLDLSPINAKGCLKAVGDWINDHSLIIGGVLLGILLPQIVFICMARNLKDSVRAQKAKW